MTLPKEQHRSRPWRVHELLHDFRLEDVWELPTPGRQEDFRRLVDLVVSADPSRSASPVARALFGVRWKLGELLGWDGASETLGSRVPSLRDRLPADLRETSAPEFAALPFSPLYLLRDEFAAEIANRTMHGVMHLGWVEHSEGEYRGELAVYVKRNGVFGALYMAAITPFRHLLYPLLLRQLGRRWAKSSRGRGSPKPLA